VGSLLITQRPPGSPWGALLFGGAFGITGKPVISTIYRVAIDRPKKTNQSPLDDRQFTA
jgi:hypothetical protein